MSSNIRIVAELEDKLSKDLRKLASDTSKELSGINTKLKEAQASFSSLGRGKADGAKRADLNATIADLKRERDEVLKNEKAEERRYKNSFKYELQKRFEVEKTTNAVVSASSREVKAKDSVTHGNYREDASRRATTTSLVRHIRQIESMAVAYYALSSTYDKTIGKGIELNAQFESMKIGIAALIATNSTDETSLGRHINATEKFTMAQGDATRAIQMLRKANLETPATLEELTVAFQSALAPASRLGFTLEQTVKYSTMMTQAAAAMGVPMNQLAQEMRSILDGSVDANSRVATALGITNKVIKEHQKSGDVYDFLTKKLEAFSAAGKAINQSFDGQKSNLVDMLDAVRLEAAKPIFDDLKVSFGDLTKYIKDNQKDIQDSFHDTYEVIKFLVSHLDDAAIALGSYYVVSRTVSALEAIRTAQTIAQTEAVILNSSAEGIRTAITMGGASAMRAQTASQIALTAATTAFTKIPTSVILGGVAAVIGVGAALIVQNADDLRASIKGIRIETDNLSLSAINARIAMEEINLQKGSKRISDPTIMEKMFGNSRQALYEDRNTKQNLQDLYAKKATLEATQNTDEIKKLRDTLAKQLESKKQLLKIHQSTANIDKAIGDTKRKILDSGEKLVQKTGSDKTGSDKTPSQLESEAKSKIAEQNRLTEALKKSKEDLEKEIFEATATDADKMRMGIKDKVDKYKEASKAKGEPASQELITTFTNTTKDKFYQEVDKKSSDDAKEILNKHQEARDKDLELEKQWQSELYKLTHTASESEKKDIEEKYKLYEKTTEDKVSLDQWRFESLAKVDKDALEKLKQDTIQLNTIFTDAFKSMEDSMVKMFMTGKFSAEDFFNSVIEGLIRMQIRNSITTPLSSAVNGMDWGSLIGGLFSGTSTTGVASSSGSTYTNSAPTFDLTKSANGNAFYGGQIVPTYAFANGGAFTNSIASSPTVAPMALFGEAGAEAIMPLTRDSSGKLGVNAGGMGGSNVVVNIENNTGTPVSEDNVSTSFDGSTMIISVVLDAITRNKGGMRDAVKGIR